MKQLVQASVWLATGSEPLQELPQQDSTLVQKKCERAAGVLMTEVASRRIPLLRSMTQRRLTCVAATFALCAGTNNGSETKRD